MSKAFQERLKVIACTKISENYFRITFASRRIPAHALGGQFVQVKVSDSTQPLLRRPFGVHRTGKGTFDCLCEIVGEATRVLSEKKPGDFVDVIGPFGNGFDYGPRTKNQGLGILVAGGMGVAPLVFLAKKLTERKTQSAKCKVIVFIGARTKKGILCEKEFKQLGCEVKVATDDGSKGLRGRVTDLLEQYLRSTLDARRPTQIFACGPKPMLKQVSFLSKHYNLPAQISLEEHMACGIGACLGCVVKVRTPHASRRTPFEYKRVCKDGPVFSAGEIIW
jgi:dihydroorotate dehydrogenase electron transfer subunit